METVPGPRSPEISAESVIDIQVIPEHSEEMAVREGIHKRMQAEMYHENKEIEARGEEMLEIPPEWNEVPDLMMEEGDILPEAVKIQDLINGREMRYPEGGENEGGKTRSRQRNKNILPQYLGGYNIRTSFRRSHRWCFATEYQRFIR